MSPIYRGIVAVAAAVLLAAPAYAALRLADVPPSESGISFSNTYGPVLSDAAIPPGCGPADGIYMQRNMGSGAAVGDYDRDGDLDVYLVGNVGVSNLLLRNNHTGGEGAAELFSDVTPTAFGLAAEETHDLGLSRVAHFVDLDGDGWQDLLVVNDDDVGLGPEDALYGPSRIFRNDRDGTFTDVTAASGFRPHGYLHAGVGLGDYDGDGLIDIYVTVWVGFGLADAPFFPGSNQMYRNKGGFVFEDVTAQVGLEGLQRDSFSAILHDFDEDGDNDLFVAVDHTQDFFYLNTDGVFDDVTTSVGIFHEANDMGIATADFDNDDDLDMYITNISPEPGGFDQLRNVLWVNQLREGNALGFQDSAVQMNAQDTYWGWGTEFVDLDNDNDLDLVAVNGFDEHTEYCAEQFGYSPDEDYYYMRPTVVLERNGATFSPSDAGIEGLIDDARGLVAFDYDRDGDADLLVTIVDAPARLLENTSTFQGHWLEVALSPDSCAIGATVRIRDSSLGFRRRDVIAGRSYLAGTPSEVHFGLGSVNEVDELEVEWADGRKWIQEDVAADQLLSVDCLPEPGAGLAAWAIGLGLGALRRDRHRRQPA